MNPYSLIMSVTLVAILIYLERGKIKMYMSQEKGISDLSQRVEAIENKCFNSHKTRNISYEREFLEHRLNGLWGLSELKKSLDEMRDKGENGWKGTTDEEDDIAWVYVYCRREIRKIGLKLRELDAEESKIQLNKE